MCGYTLQASGCARLRDQTASYTRDHAPLGITISHGSCHHASEPFYQELSDRSQFSHNMTVCSRRTKEYQTIINPVSTERVIIIIPYVDLLQEFDYFDHGINSVLLRLVKTKSLFRQWSSLDMFKTKFHVENH
jgi:hypothetical protein